MKRNKIKTNKAQIKGNAFRVPKDWDVKCHMQMDSDWAKQRVEQKEKSVPNGK